MSPLTRYSRWDGTQQLDDLDADDLLEAMADDLLADGDSVERAAAAVPARGAEARRGQDARASRSARAAARQRQQQLDRYDLGSALDDIKKKLDEIIKTEREGIERR